MKIEDLLYEQMKKDSEEREPHLNYKHRDQDFGYMIESLEYYILERVRKDYDN